MNDIEEIVKKWLKEHPKATIKLAYESGYIDGYKEGFTTKPNKPDNPNKPLKEEWIPVSETENLPQVAMNVWVSLKNGLVFRDMSLDASDYGYFQNHALEEVEAWHPYFEPKPYAKPEHPDAKPAEKE